MKKLRQKGQLDNLGVLVTTLVFLGILLAIVFLILTEVKTQADAVLGYNGSYAHNATNEIQNAVQDIPSWLAIIVITVIGGILLSLIQFFRR